MTDLPANVKVGPFIYGVAFGKRHLKGSTASVSHNLAEIRLQPGRNPLHDRESLLHELLHVIIYASGHQFRNVENTDMHESLVHTLSPALLDVLRRNPDLVAYLTQEDVG